MKKIINLPIGSYISDVEPFCSTGIPNNSIIHKELTGCGITTFEIKHAQHNSIIILPNVPVIKDKVAKHNKEFKDSPIIGVHKGIDVDDIKAYLLKDIQFKKILTTPEGFVKVEKAFSDRKQMLKQFFLLFDECERIITDVSYRGKIAAPINTFFEFERKALVSATTLPFSDERFSQFEHYVIKPDYDYAQPMTLINTNNVLWSLKTFTSQLDERPICIFFNSTDGIFAAIDTLDIHSQSKVFCAQESVVKLLEKKYRHASDEFKPEDMVKYNFFTSRYFSAFDIALRYKPHVIIVSDVHFAKHSIVDPHTEVIQIAGRFRNGRETLTHITNFKPGLDVKSQEEAKSYLDGCLDTYDAVIKWYQRDKIDAVRDTLMYFINDSPIAQFYSNGRRNHFMIDNELHQERVKSYYQTPKALTMAYADVVAHFQLSHQIDGYPVGDSDWYDLKNFESKADKNRHLAYLLQRYLPKPGSMHITFPGPIEDQRNILIRRNPELAEAVRLVGVEGIEPYGFSLHGIRKCVTNAKLNNQIRSSARIVQPLFNEVGFVSEETIIERLASVYKQHSISAKLYAKHILRYFNGTRTTSNKINGFTLQGRKPFA